jgi:hypothetical protein
LPRFPGIMTRSNAARALASGKEESITGRIVPSSTSWASSTSCSRLGSTTNYLACIFSLTAGGSRPRNRSLFEDEAVQGPC